MLVAVMMMLAMPEQAASDCASAAPRGPDFMAMISGGSKPDTRGRKRDRLGGTIVDPPVRTAAIAPGARSTGPDISPFPVDRPDVQAAPEDAEQHARNESAGICNAAKRPA